jgi:hypothetical protein
MGIGGSTKTKKIMRRIKNNEAELIALKALVRHCKMMESLASRGIAEENKVGKPSAKTLSEAKNAVIEMGKLILAVRRASRRLKTDSASVQ